MRSLKRTLLACCTAALAAGPAGSSPALARPLFRVELAYEVRPDSARDSWILVDGAGLTLEPGMSGSAFVGNAGVKVVVATAGSAQHLLDVTLTTLPPQAKVLSRQLLLDVNRPLEIAGLAYKSGREARVLLRIRRQEGELACGFGSKEGARSVDEYVSDIPLHGAPSMILDTLGVYDDQLWYADPSAHFELFYIPNTLGDLGWNLARDYLEKEFNQFDNVFHLYRAQRVNYFLAPCRVPEIAWLPHRDWAVEPTTFRAYALYSRDVKGISGIPTMANYLYRYLGYAPFMVVEGAARGFEYDHYYAKKLKWRRKLPQLARHWRTAEYKSYPDSALAIASGSFFSYLIGTRGLDKFYRLYGLADDFNADSAFGTAYGEDFGTLEREWRHFLDTMRVYPHMAGFFVARAKILGKNQEAIELLHAMIEVDTLDVSPYREELALLHFLEGEYDQTVAVLNQLDERSKQKIRSRHLRNSALFFGGRADQARAAYERTIADSAITPGVETAWLMYGWMELSLGNLARADSLLLRVERDAGPQSLDRIEALLHRADILRRQGAYAAADSLLLQAREGTQLLLSTRSLGADLYLRLGECYVGLGQPDTAMIYLDMAEFLEFRPFYKGRIWTAYGNAYDLLGMRQQAKAHYHRVLSERSSFPSRQAARRYLREPYRSRGA